MPRRDILRHQIWRSASATAPSTTPHCTPFSLPSHGVISISPEYTITLKSSAIFVPECTGGPSSVPSTSVPSSITDLRDPFYASTIPLAYAIAAATILSYMLFIMLLITPRTFFNTDMGGRGGFLSRRGLIGGAPGSESIVGVGRRPWLQKLAALTVVISLTIASADTFRVAERQYNVGYMDAPALRDEVVEGLEIRIVRVISDTFLWLAQVQTLVRLFPRQKEKVIIKWTGFALIVLDTLFSVLNNFLSTGNTRPDRFVDAIPALSYLFHISLSLLYAAWVIYYSVSKRRFAFYHTNMPNICLVAILSLSAVLIPLTFFVLDVSNPSLAGWGDYVRWVGAAAASVVVWEWVERIEALEREERKDGVLGREIFDGDEMLETTSSSEIQWPGGYGRNNGNGGAGAGGGPGTGHLHPTGGIGASWEGMTGVANRFSRSRIAPRALHQNNVNYGRVQDTAIQSAQQGQKPSASQLSAAAFQDPPISTSTPVSRANSASVASTVYAVHYHTVSEATPPIPEQLSGFEDEADVGRPIDPGHHSSAIHMQGSIDRCQNSGPARGGDTASGTILAQENVNDGENRTASRERKILNESRRLRWHAVSHPFKRRGDEPPVQVADAAATLSNAFPAGSSTAGSSSLSQGNGAAKRNLKATIRSFAANQNERLRNRANGSDQEVHLPLRVIPAQQRARRFRTEDEEVNDSAAAAADGAGEDSDLVMHGPALESLSRGKGIDATSHPGLATADSPNHGSRPGGIT